MKFPYSIALGIPLLGGSAMAADLTLKVELAQLDVAEYHKPYVAVWVEGADQGVVGNLAVLYDTRKKDNAGAKWLKDMRQWWRKSGRDLQMPMDGVSGATRAPGQHQLSFQGAKAMLDKLPAGQYKVAIEVAREAGGRETVRIPFGWPLKAPLSVSANGKEELGGVTLQIKP